MVVRQNPERLPRLDAGDEDLAGAIQGHQRVRNSVAHTPGPFPAAGVAQNGDEPKIGGTKTHGQNTNSDNELRSEHSSVC